MYDKNKLKALRKSYEEIITEYKRALRVAIKDVITIEIGIPAGGILDVEDMVREGEISDISKYETPDDTPYNYGLYLFHINNNGKLIITGQDHNDNMNEYKFDESDFTIDELEDIYNMMKEIANEEEPCDVQNNYESKNHFQVKNEEGVFKVTIKKP